MTVRLITGVKHGQSAVRSTKSRRIVELFTSQIRQRSPNMPAEQIMSLAQIWGSHLDRIVDRIQEITRETGRVAWHIDSREEAIGQMARMLGFLTEKIVDHRTKGRSIDSIDPKDEQVTLQEPTALERVENTAQVMARAWCTVYDDLARKHPLIGGTTEREWPPRLPGSGSRQSQPGTTHNHFIPRFSTKPWADASGLVRQFRRKRYGAVSARERSFRSFGHERFLYPQRLEDWFSQVEQQAQVPYSRLVSSDALTQENRYFWIAFLTTQHLRTPSYMATIAKGLRRRAKEEKWPWAMTPSLLRTAHTLLFDEDRLFTAYYRRFSVRRWEIWRAADGFAFPRTDCPVVAVVPDDGRGWRCFYPLTPTQCFVAGPQRAEEGDVPAALTRRLSPHATLKLVRLLISSTSSSFVTRRSDPQAEWLQLAQQVPTRDPLERYRAWGELDEL